MLRNIGAPEIIILGVLIIVIFGWKRLPDAARSLGRSARVFKAEVQEMKSDSPGETVRGETVDHDQAQGSSQERQQPGESTTSNPVHENAPRTDNQSGPTT